MCKFNSLHLIHSLMVSDCGACWADVRRSIYGVLFWCPLLIDSILTGNFSGVHSSKPPPVMSAKETVRCRRPAVALAWE